MGEHLLRLLMVVCTLGAEWKDPEKIPVKDFINIWRSQSTVRVRAKRGRYEGEIWKAHMLRSRWRDQVVATLRLTFRLRWLLLQLRWLLLRLRHWLLCPPLPCSSGRRSARRRLSFVARTDAGDARRAAALTAAAPAVTASVDSP